MRSGLPPQRPVGCDPRHRNRFPDRPALRTEWPKATARVHHSAEIPNGCPTGFPLGVQVARSSQSTRSRGSAEKPHRACNPDNPRVYGRPRPPGRRRHTCSRTGRSTGHDTRNRNRPNAHRCIAQKVTEAVGRLPGTGSMYASGNPLVSHQTAPVAHDPVLVIVHVPSSKAATTTAPAMAQVRPPASRRRPCRALRPPGGVVELCGPAAVRHLRGHMRTPTGAAGATCSSRARGPRAPRTRVVHFARPERASLHADLGWVAESAFVPPLPNGSGRSAWLGGRWRMMTPDTIVFASRRTRTPVGFTPRIAPPRVPPAPVRGQHPRQCHCVPRRTPP